MKIIPGLSFSRRTSARRCQAAKSAALDERIPLKSPHLDVFRPPKQFDYRSAVKHDTDILLESHPELRYLAEKGKLTLW